MNNKMMKIIRVKEVLKRDWQQAYDDIKSIDGWDSAIQGILVPLQRLLDGDKSLIQLDFTDEIGQILGTTIDVVMDYSPYAWQCLLAQTAIEFLDEYTIKEWKELCNCNNLDEAWANLVGIFHEEFDAKEDTPPYDIYQWLSHNTDILYNNHQINEVMLDRTYLYYKSKYDDTSIEDLLDII